MFVSMSNSGDCLFENVEKLGKGKCDLLIQNILQTLSFEKVKDDVRLAVHHAESAHAGNIGVTELLRHLCLLLKAANRLQIQSEFRSQDFNRHDSVEIDVPSAVNLAHAALSGYRQNLVALVKNCLRK